MRFTTTHTQPSAVKRELIPLRQYHVLLLCKMLSHSAHWASVLWRRKAYQRLRLSPMAPIWTVGVLVIHHRWLHTCRRACLTLQRRLDHAGLCMEKHRVSCICYLSKTHFVRDFLQNSIGNSSTSTTCNPIYSEGTILELQITMEFHRQLRHQHHLQSHLQWGNDPRVANHNGIPSATPPPAPLATPFTMRERSYSCKSQWNSVDRTCTKNTWNPIYNAEPIREWSEHDPPMIRAWSDHTRDRLATVAPQR